MSSLRQECVAPDESRAREGNRPGPDTSAQDALRFRAFNGVQGRAGLLALQRTAGNTAVGTLLRRSPRTRGADDGAVTTARSLVVQQCGKEPCDCADEVSQTSTHGGSPPAVQRQTSVDPGNADPVAPPSPVESSADQSGGPITSVAAVTGSLSPGTSPAPAGGQRLCFPPAAFTDPQFGSGFGTFAERMIEQDYCDTLGCDPATTFLDKNNPTQYKDFLTAHNPALATGAKAVALAIASATGIARPDILTDDGGRQDYYEIKPLSPSGAAAGVEKLAEIAAFMAALGLPYVPGTTYSPSKDIPIMAGVVIGEPLAVSLNVNRFVPGIVTYSLCLQGNLAQILTKVAMAALLAWIVAQLLPVLVVAAA